VLCAVSPFSFKTKHEFVSKENHVTNYIRKIDANVLGGAGSAETTGGWNKGALTTSLCLFVADFCAVRDLERHEDEVLRLVASQLNMCGIPAAA
jgi:hypothetical protein